MRTLLSSPPLQLRIDFQSLLGNTPLHLRLNGIHHLAHHFELVAS
jgi:hypothetical protein